jgi:hypothetical protein
MVSHLMAFNFSATIGLALAISKFAFGKSPSLIRFWNRAGRDALLIEDEQVTRAET